MLLLAFPWNPVLHFSLGPIVKFESIRPAALFIAFVNPATDCVFHLNGCCRELFGCLIRIAFHWNACARCGVGLQTSCSRGRRRSICLNPWEAAPARMERFLEACFLPIGSSMYLSLQASEQKWT